MTLDELLASPTALPSMPRIVAQLLAELDNDEPDLRRINQLISQDPGLVVRLLRLSNAAVFGRSAKIGSVSEALAMLGLGHVRSLVMVATLAGSFGSIPNLDMTQFWRCSLDVAKMSRSLATACAQPSGVAFTAGLVHAIGELVMNSGMPHTMRQLDSAARIFALQRPGLEARELGFTFAEVGAGFAKNWRFPDMLTTAIRDQNDPLGSDDCEPMAAVLHLAAWRVRGRETGLAGTALTNSFPDVVGLALGLDAEAVLASAPADWTAANEAMLFY